LRIARFALLVEAPDFTVAEAEEALHRHTALDTVLLQGLDDRADHPPELEHRLTGRDLLELLGDGCQDVEVLFGTLTADPADETGLETGAETAGPLLHRQ